MLGGTSTPGSPSLSRESRLTHFTESNLIRLSWVLKRGLQKMWQGKQGKQPKLQRQNNQKYKYKIQNNRKRQGNCGNKIKSFYFQHCLRCWWPLRHFHYIFIIFSTQYPVTSQTFLVVGHLLSVGISQRCLRWYWTSFVDCWDVEIWNCRLLRCLLTKSEIWRHFDYYQ